MKIAGTTVSLKSQNGVKPVFTSAVARSVLGALAYADLFDFPLTLPEIVRYQIGTQYSQEELGTALRDEHTLKNAVTLSQDGYYCLVGRETVFEIRKERQKASLKIWERAYSYAKILAHFPFVRMIAVTGALAVNNIAQRPDIDFLVVTSPGRVWIARRLIVGLVRLARLRGDDLCPNYIISDNNLKLDQRDLFTSHELAQMVPTFGADVYQEMLAQNSWATSYLPSAFEGSRFNIRKRRPGLVQKGIERVLGLGFFDRWERWEMMRLQKKLRPQIGDSAEVICSPDQCKGHTGLHRQWVTTSYEQRLNELDLV